MREVVARALQVDLREASSDAQLNDTSISALTKPS